MFKGGPMRCGWQAFLVVAALLPVGHGMIAPTSAATSTSALANAQGAAALDGDTLLLADGRTVRLAGIAAPKPPPGEGPPGREDGRRWPLAEAATAALAELAVGRELRLPGRAPLDRHGRILAQLERTDGVWLQGELLRRGLARVATRPDARDRAADMLAAETAARRAGLGLWATAAFAVRSADPQALRGDRYSVQVVEGRVERAAKVRGTVYLNFGADWRTDVTARIDGAALKRFAAAGLDPLSLERSVVRIRGWIGDYNGPMIDLTHPEQVERVAGPDGAPGPAPAAGGGGDAWNEAPEDGDGTDGEGGE